MAHGFLIADILANVAVLTGSPPFASDTRVTSSQANYFVSQALRGLSALMQQHFPDSGDTRYVSGFVANPSISIPDSLPANAGQVHAVLWNRAPGEQVLLQPAQQDDLHLTADEDWTQIEPKWRIEGEKLRMYPPPKETQFLALHHTTDVVQLFGGLVARADADKWVELDVAINVHTSKKQYGEAAAKQQMKSLLENDFLSSARELADHEPPTIRDVRGARALEAYRSRWGG
jgi:hypothetical protein